MSLHKTYRVQCDGRSLGRHKGIHLGISPEHQQFGPGSEDSVHARRRAMSAGWKRVTVELPILDSTPSAGTSKVPFDLCPACAQFAN